MAVDDFLPFARPNLDHNEIDEVMSCLASGWLTTGPRTKKFEDALQEYLGAPYVLALNSATAGLHLALLSLDLQPGDEVITTPLTFAASLNTIVLAGAKPVLVDVDPQTLNMDVNAIEAKINAKTRAILPVHFAGLPVDLEVVYGLAKKYQLRVIEDAAHAIGAQYKGKRLGSFGDTQVFSFHPNKNMTTGEGGCIATRDAQLAQRVSVLRFHGIDRDAFDRHTLKGSHHYDVIEPGFKYNMLDLQAALGLHQLPKLDDFIQKRAKIVAQYREALADCPQVTLPGESANQEGHAWHLMTVFINPEHAKVSRDEFMLQMKQQQIGTGYHYQAVHLYSYYQKQFGFKRGDFPVAEDISDRIVSLPLFPQMTHHEYERVIHAMQQIL